MHGRGEPSPLAMRLERRVRCLTSGKTDGATVPAASAGEGRSSLARAAATMHGTRLMVNCPLLIRRMLLLAGVVSMCVGFRTVVAADTAPGAGWWSLQPVKRPIVPAIESSPGATPIDAFIRQKLSAVGLEPLPAADRRTLIRRATFDLTGLPPTPEQVGAFLADESPDAFAKLIDRLLGSPQYGERWGRHWLDVVRYADTAGETADYPVAEAYRFRNYVIDALNADKPYDDFIREQIAGDILAHRAWQAQMISPERYAELITATGFLAIARRFGFDTERYEHLTIQDTIDTIGQAVQGLTLGCARCHDHKYDPVSMEDYYALYGFFASTRFAFGGSERLPSTRAMTPLVSAVEAKQRWEAWQQQITEVSAQIRLLKPDHRLPCRPTALRPLTDLDGDLELQTPPSGGSLGLPANPWQFGGHVRITTAAQSPFTNVYPQGANGAKIEAGQSDFFLGRGVVSSPVSAKDQVLYFGLEIRNLGGNPDQRGSYRIYLGGAGGQSPALELFVSREALFVRDGGAVRRLSALDQDKWYQLQIALDLQSRTFEGSVVRPGETVRFSGTAYSPGENEATTYFMVDGHGHLEGPKPGFEVDNFLLSGSPPPSMQPPVAAHKAATEKESESTAQQQAQLKQLEQRLTELINTTPYPTAYAVWEGTPRDVHIQQRGEPEQPGELAPRRFLAALGGARLSSETKGSGRAQLAEWLTHNNNPLTARVIVNRIWQHHFGHGLVRTENEFGVRGQPPTHPRLLDWLASVFMDGGWSIKSLHRRIMLSNVYQRSSAEHAAAAAIDPDNKLLARFPRRRLDAESIRDALLALSGELDLSRGGPHAFPLLTKARYSQHNPFRGEQVTNLRSVYRLSQRLKRDRFFALFDAPDANTSTPKRTASTVPTQALYMMNDPAVHRLSQGFARRLLSKGSSGRSRIVLAFEMALARPPAEEEIEATQAFVGRYRGHLVQSGTFRGEQELRQQTWAAVARTLFARNEFVYID